MIYDETYVFMNQSLKSVENNIFSNKYHVTELDIALQRLCLGIGKSSHHKFLTYECWFIAMNLMQFWVSDYLENGKFKQQKLK